MSELNFFSFHLLRDLLTFSHVYKKIQRFQSYSLDFSMRSSYTLAGDILEAIRVLFLFSSSLYYNNLYLQQKKKWPLDVNRSHQTPTVSSVSS